MNSCISILTNHAENGNFQGGGGEGSNTFWGTRYSILLASGSPTLSCFFALSLGNSKKAQKLECTL